MGDFTQISPGTHGLLDDSNVIIGKLDVNKDRETWHWKSDSVFPSTFKLLAGPPNASYQSPQIYDYPAEGLEKSLTAISPPTGTTVWKIERVGTVIGWLARPTSGNDKVLWYIKDGNVTETGRIITGDDTLVFSTITTSVTPDKYHHSVSNRLPAP